MSGAHILAGGLHTPQPERYEPASVGIAARLAERVRAERMRSERLAAETIPAPAVTCTTCNDTHVMGLGSDAVMCTRCPIPCEAWPEPEGGIAGAALRAALLEEIGEAPAVLMTEGELQLLREEDDEPALDEPTALDHAHAARIIAQGRLEDIVDGATMLCLSWEAAARKRDAIGYTGEAALIRGFIADMRVLFSGTSAGDDQ